MTQGGHSNATFTVAVNRRFKNAQGEREADFIKCVAWRQTADYVARYIKQGDHVIVEGAIQTRTYDAQDGSKRYVTELVADQVESVGRRKDSTQGPAAGEHEPRGEFKEVQDDDLPF